VFIQKNEYVSDFTGGKGGKCKSAPASWGEGGEAMDNELGGVEESDDLAEKVLWEVE